MALSLSTLPVFIPYFIPLSLFLNLTSPKYHFLILLNFILSSFLSTPLYLTGSHSLNYSPIFPAILALLFTFATLFQAHATLQQKMTPIR